MNEDRIRTSLSRFGRRDFIRYAGVFAGAAALAACRRDEAPTIAGAGSPSPTLTRSIEDELGDLHVYEWSGYEIEELWQPYKEQFPDAEPDFTFLTTPDEALSKIAGGFKADLVHPELSFMQEFIELGVFQPFDTSLISNFPALNPALVQAGQFDGQQYAIPLDWGFV
ncbi:MAG TPA: PotD/PotF family extracellular solute-binding protein, partial [Actinomycetota bacterium]